MDGGRVVRRRMTDAGKQFVEIDSIIDLDPDFPSPISHAARPAARPAAGDPILFCSLPDTPMWSSAEAEILGLGSVKAPLTAGKQKAVAPPGKTDRPFKIQRIDTGEVAASSQIPSDLQFTEAAQVTAAQKAKVRRCVQNLQELVRMLERQILMESSQVATAPKATSPKHPPSQPNKESVIGDSQVTTAPKTASLNHPPPQPTMESVMGDSQVPKAPKTASSNHPPPQPNKKSVSDEGSAAAAVNDAVRQSSNNPPELIRNPVGNMDSRASWKTLEGMDILDVLAMKGHHMPRVTWWRKEGYDPKPKKPK